MVKPSEIQQRQILCDSENSPLKNTAFHFIYAVAVHLVAKELGRKDTVFLRRKKTGSDNSC